MLFSIMLDCYSCSTFAIFSYFFLSYYLSLLLIAQSLSSLLLSRITSLPTTSFLTQPITSPPWNYFHPPLLLLLLTHYKYSPQNALLLKVEALPTIIKAYLARVNATFILFSSPIKPVFCWLFERTVDINIMSRSWPW